MKDGNKATKKKRKVGVNVRKEECEEGGKECKEGI